MKIVYLAAGAAGMYCGACLHDNTLAAALGRLGEDILLVPTYTPIRTDETDVSAPPVFFGGINVYLEEKFPPWRWLPKRLTGWLDSPRVLRLIERLDLAVRADKLAGLTLSMVRGEHGHQRRELDHLVDWLKREARPDVVHLSNALMAGMARQIRERLDVPVVCSLAGEDVFFDQLPPKYYTLVRDELRRRAGDITRFVAFNQYYAGAMAEYLDIALDRISIVPHGLSLTGHGSRATRHDDEFCIGYLARICPEKGLHHLVEAFRLLAGDPALPRLKLKIAGYLGAGDRRYWQSLQRRLHEAGLDSRVEYCGEVTRAQKIAFLQSLDVMSVPADYRESKGLSILEALANAVPVVLPEHGTYPELVGDTGGGLLFAPHDPHDLARQLRQLIPDRPLLDKLGRAGQDAVRQRYHDRLMAERHQALYRQVIEQHRASAGSTIAERVQAST